MAEQPTAKPGNEIKTAVPALVVDSVISPVLSPRLLPSEKDSEFEALCDALSTSICEQADALKVEHGDAQNVKKWLQSRPDILKQLHNGLTTVSERTTSSAASAKAAASKVTRLFSVCFCSCCCVSVGLACALMLLGCFQAGLLAPHVKLRVFELWLDEIDPESM